MQTHLAFRINRSQIERGILIPKFYDPELQLAVRAASCEFELPELGDILYSGVLGSQLGVWIEREHYGSGNIPYVRTSDLSHWRIRADYKKGVSAVIYTRFKSRIDIQKNDLLMVAHGSYLVGTAAMVTSTDGRILLQDHVFRLRPNPASGIEPELLLAALSTRFVRRQVRSRQFSADIIDKIGERHLGLRIPIPRNHRVRDQVIANVRLVLEEQTKAREEIRRASGSDLRMTRERAEARHGFTVPRSSIKNRILIPKYYDPDLERELAEAESNWDGPWLSLGELSKRGHLKMTTGVEVGKMAYGTGNIPFIRTSDLVDWEIKRDPRQGVSKEIYQQYEKKAALRQNDIVLVRDGTYLVGSSALVSESDVPALFCGGIFRIRVQNTEKIDPHALLAYLNLPIVRRQLRARQFTRDVIDTLGYRVFEVKIPAANNRAGRALADRVRAVMERKSRVKSEISETVRLLEPTVPAISAGRPGWSMR